MSIDIAVEKKNGRPSQGKVKRTFTLDKEVAEFLDSLPDGLRSHYVNEQLARSPEFQASRFYEQWKRRTGRG